MSACPTCGIDRGRIAKFGPLTVTSDPPGAFWNGSLLHDLDPAKLRILLALARTGSASHAQLHMTTGEDADLKAIHVHICNIRKRLPRGITVKNVRGWGYKLELEETMTDKTTTKAVDTPRSIRDLAVAAAGNIAGTDQAAVLAVVQADGSVRVTPFATSVPNAIQTLSLANVVLAKALQAKPVQGVVPAEGQQAAA